jgi:hypothetical protein
MIRGLFSCKWKWAPAKEDEVTIRRVKEFGETWDQGLGTGDQ